MIGTSINIEQERLNRFRKASAILHLSESELLSILLMKSRRLFGDNAVTGKTVDYQKNDNSCKFVIHHININESDYELATGKRYLFKISVSFIIRLAIDTFLSEILLEWNHNRSRSNLKWKMYCTNIYYTSFTIDHVTQDFAEFWTIPWPRE